MLRDAFNRAISIGDVVVYPARKRSRCWLQALRVDQIQPDKLGGWLPNGRHAQIWGGTLQHVAIIRKATLEGAAERRRELAAAN